MRLNTIIVILMAVVETSSLQKHSDAQEILPDGTDAALRAISTIQVPAGLQMELFAAEPQLASPVAICLDEQDRVYVAEEYRFNRGTEENRTRPFFLEDDLQIKSLDDRLAMYRKFADRFDGGMDWFSKVSDQVRILEDRDGDGRADFSKIFAGGFNDPLDGLAAGVIARDGDIYLTCIPNLWLLKDTNGDGEADVRKSLHRGFGVNCGFLGHDLHGLVWGPAGRLYFSVGDRGFNVTSKEGKHFVGPRRGAVFRCDPDGSNLELIHIGLRNPQELAFDEFGNLFAADNNCDKGDLSRLVYVVEGGDSGWNMAYQTIPDPYLTGPWHAENMWHVEAPDRPAWVLPPVGALGAGPSGFVYYPGLGLDKRYDGHFFLCNYTGNGGIDSFAVEPKGAGFRIIDDHNFLKPIRATDVDFGYDGKMYIADFVNLDWQGKSLGGRIYTLFDRQRNNSDEIKRVTNLFKEGFGKQSTSDLIELFEHPDMRVRLRSQYEVARRPNDSIKLLKQLAASKDVSARKRRHAIWALWQIARSKSLKSSAAAKRELHDLLEHKDIDTRLQALRALGDLRSSTSQVHELLRDENPRIRFFAGMAIARVDKESDVTDDIVRFIEQNAGQDPYLRHAGVMALCKFEEQVLIDFRKNDNVWVRMSALLALRKQKSTGIVKFLNDPDIRVVIEAARAINDLPIETSMTQLAGLTQRILQETQLMPDPLIRRVINANFRLGQKEGVESLIQLVVQKNLSASMRREAIECLMKWESPGSRDRVTGFWRPCANRPTVDIRSVIQGNADRLAGGANGEVLASVLTLLTKYNVEINDSEVVRWASDEKRTAKTRIESLKLLTTRKSKNARDVLDSFLKSNNPALRSAGREQLVKTDVAAAIDSFDSALADETTTTLERQSALQILPTLNRSEADELLANALRTVVHPPANKRRQQFKAVELDVTAAAEKRKVGQIPELLRSYFQKQKDATKTDSLAEYRPAMFGGSVDRGETLFRGHRQAQCMRCHKANGYGGDAGPDLSKVATRGNREYLLESIVHPNAKLAKGFGTVSLVTDKGHVVSGAVQSETDTEITIATTAGDKLTFKTAEIVERTTPKSPMPAVHHILNKHQIRDLVEFLSTLK